ncbi:EAL domain-containing protein [Shewanella sp. VB17]|uniref:GGDEF domain-containing protein n=1 Tax=Shewanella sp. VB17 TaxID=2739432 RepID=UPI001567A77A|nr:GGDEF domain-containing protein [Shewanella sp. VB17]NRD74569.1 EAL domain-containing protein [Shewanella sp. VB17]
MRIFNRIQTRIFAFFVVLLIGVQAISFAITFFANKRLEQQQLNHQLSVAELVFKSDYGKRNYYLSAFAETAAKDFGLKDFFINDDSRSFLVALNNHRKRIDADLAIAVDKHGIIIGELMLDTNRLNVGKVSIGPEQGKPFRYSLETDYKETHSLYELENHIYQIKFAPLNSGANNVIGWVGFGFIMGDELAKTLQLHTGLNTGFVVTEQGQNNQFISLSGDDLNAADNEAVSNFIHHGHANEDYVLWHEWLGKVDEKEVHAFMYLTRHDVLEAFQKQWLQQLGLILLMLPISLLLAFIISRGVTKPIQLLIEQARYIAKGNYKSKVQVGNNVEMQLLAEEFTIMQEAILSRESEIAFQAYHDPLTHLGNKNELERVTFSWFADKMAVAICLIDIKRMTEVNGTLGHVVGDEVIKEMGRRLLSLDNIDLVCRLSGDDFVLAFKDISPKELRILMIDLQKSIEAEYRYQDISLHLQLTIGISFVYYPSNLETVMRQADTALQYAKKHKLDQQIYNQQIDVNTLARLQLINELKSAIDNNELVLFYQPKLDLKLKKVTHVEALVRWQHPDRGIILPDEFIPIAEQMGQMNALTRWVMNESIVQYLQWKSEGIDLSIAINISAENLKDEYFCQYVLDVMSDRNIPIEALTLEITEDAVVSDPENAIKQLKILKKYGLKLSIDDYGTGYSSLAQLKMLPVDELKIDKSFVQNLMMSLDDQIIVSSTLQLAHSLGLTVVAEGIEDEGTLNWLIERGCEMGQGYYLSRPIPADKIANWLTNSHY